MITSGIILSAIIQGAFKLFLATAAIVAARLTLYWFDASIEDDGATFGQTLREADANYKMLYFACRFIGVCIVVGLAIS